MNSVNIYIEANPNPNSLKFVTDRMLLQNNEIKENTIEHKLFKMVNLYPEQVLTPLVL